MAFKLRKMDVEAVNATVAKLNPQPMVDAGSDTRTDVRCDTLQHTSKGGGLCGSLADKLAEVEILTLGEKLAEKMG